MEFEDSVISNHAIARLLDRKLVRRACVEEQRLSDLFEDAAAPAILNGDMEKAAERGGRQL